MHAGEGKHYSFPFGTPRNMCLQHVFKWAAYRCFQSCCSPREGLRANQRRLYLVRETLLSYSACFSEKMQIDSFLLLRTTSDKGVPRQSSPFRVLGCLSPSLSFPALPTVQAVGGGEGLWIVAQKMREEMHSNEQLGEETEGRGHNFVEKALN